MKPLPPSPPPPPGPLLAVEGLRVGFGPPGRAAVEIVRGLSFRVGRGETLAIVGESGSGKSVTCLALLGLLPRPAARVLAGRALFDGRGDLLALDPAGLRRLRGDRIGMVFQEPMTALNPVVTVGTQLAEGLIAHRGLGRAAARRRAAEMLDLVGLDRPAARLRQYPHELSGGMRQRVMLAAAMALEPDLLIADEPTTALDVTVQAQILDLMRELKDRFGASLVLVTHDMGVVAEMADRVLVMRRGALVEEGHARDVFAAPRAAYTQELLRAVPRLDARPDLGTAPAAAPAAVALAVPILRLRAVEKRFAVREGWLGRREVRAVDGVSLEVGAGETLALVGESGSGKSTLGRLAARLEDVDGGRIEIGGRDVTRARGAALRRLRRRVQVVFQDPYASLNPRLRVGDALVEPMAIHGLARGSAARARAGELLRRVGLDPAAMRRWPHELSGGQRQRIALARALAAEPELIVADEPTSALDVSVQAQVIDLLRRLQAELGLAFLFISHDLAVVRRVSHRIAVMRHGRLLELAPAEALFERPRHPYTRALLAAAPVPDPTARRGPRAPPPERCPAGPLAEVGPGHWVATAAEGVPAA